MPNNELPIHGGDIVSASANYGIGLDQWVDLSTGINPESYPVELSDASFKQLPYVRPEFITASTEYYRSSQFIPVTGTQAAIQQLPFLLADFPVLIPMLGYQEHVKYWSEKNADIHYYPALEKRQTIDFIDDALHKNNQQHVVIINPNNPTGALLEKEQLLSWAEQLAPKAYLVVDEAFIDIISEYSVLDYDLPDNIIVLRSFGKFFGLGGIRLGYCFANTSILTALQDRIGLWQVNGPAQAIAIKALNDREWQLQARLSIKSNAELTQGVFEPLIQKLGVSLLESFSSGPRLGLLSSYLMPCQEAVALSQYFAQAGILLRVIVIDDEQALLRIGLLDKNNSLLVKRVIKRVESALLEFSSHKEIAL